MIVLENSAVVYMLILYFSGFPTHKWTSHCFEGLLWSFLFAWINRSSTHFMRYLITGEFRGVPRPSNTWVFFAWLSIYHYNSLSICYLWDLQLKTLISISFRYKETQPVFIAFDRGNTYKRTVLLLATHIQEFGFIPHFMKMVFLCLRYWFNL